MKYYYTRNSYTLSFDTDLGTPLNSQTLRFEQDIPTIGITTRTGYHLPENVAEAWINYPADGKMPATGLTLKANWIANTNTPYTVEHYFQNMDGITYPETTDVIDNLSGTTDQLTNVVAKDIP